MTDEQILELMMQRTAKPYDGTLSEAICRYAHQVASMSDRIDSKDLVELISIGADLYQVALRDFEASENAQEILANLQRRREK